jgi:PTEN phosphatase family protein
LKKIGNGDGTDLHLEIIVNKQVVHELPFNLPVAQQVEKAVKIIKENDEIKIKFNEESCPALSGDIKVRFHSSNPSVPKDYDFCAFFFWFHTSFVHENKLYLPRHEIGNAHKPKTWNSLFVDSFAISMKFTEPKHEVVTPNLDLF